MSRIKKRKIYDHRNKTGFNGVSKKRKKFKASISIDGKNTKLGTFTKARDAAMAYDEAIVANQLPSKNEKFSIKKYFRSEIGRTKKRIKEMQICKGANLREISFFSLLLFFSICMGFHSFSWNFKIGKLIFLENITYV